MDKAIIGKKLGMTQMFTETGELIPVTAILAGPCPVIQVKALERDGYQAVQVGFDEIPERKLNKPASGHFTKANAAPHRVLREFRLTRCFQNRRSRRCERDFPWQRLCWRN
jgi:large subunit ribosomal protein L3